MTDPSVPVRNLSIATLFVALLADACVRRPASSVQARLADASVTRQSVGAFERNERAFAVSRSADSAYFNKTYSVAAELYAGVAQDFRDPVLGHYNAARAFALAGRPAEAVKELKLALRAGYRRTAEMQREDDLASLRGGAPWPRLVAIAADNQRAFQRAHADPARAKIVTSDIDHFWRAYDLAATRATPDERADAYRREYFDPGSAGLLDYYSTKIYSVENFVQVIDTHPRYYASLRPSSLRVAAQEAPIRAAFRKMKALYANATFPDVYFVMGSLMAAGTVSDLGLLLGVDQSTAALDSPRDELIPTLRA